MKQLQFNCPVEVTLSLIGSKYKPLILWQLVDCPLHYMELQRRIPSATLKMLSQQLHVLEGCGMVHREVIPEKPPKKDGILSDSTEIAREHSYHLGSYALLRL
jgi:DNA-binding HxlR family transcriptional regulator